MYQIMIVAEIHSCLKFEDFNETEQIKQTRARICGTAG